MAEALLKAGVVSEDDDKRIRREAYVAKWITEQTIEGLEFHVESSGQKLPKGVDRKTFNRLAPRYIKLWKDMGPKLLKEHFGTTEVSVGTRREVQRLAMQAVQEAESAR